eukprot:231717-Pyramimonas_sp.AAC.1
MGPPQGALQADVFDISPRPISLPGPSGSPRLAPLEVVHWQRRPARQGAPPHPPAWARGPGPPAGRRRKGGPP